MTGFTHNHKPFISVPVKILYTNVQSVLTSMQLCLEIILL